MLIFELEQFLQCMRHLKLHWWALYGTLVEKMKVCVGAFGLQSIPSFLYLDDFNPH